VSELSRLVYLCVVQNGLVALSVVLLGVAVACGASDTDPIFGGGSTSSGAPIASS
jgi:hypothetical protein